MNDLIPTRRPHGTFLPGQAPTNGRPRGSPNKTTRDVKEALLDAAVAHGRDGAGENGLAGFYEHAHAVLPEKVMDMHSKLLPRTSEPGEQASAGAGFVEFQVLPVAGNHYVLGDGIVDEAAAREAWG